MKKQSKLLILVLTLAMLFSVLGAFAITSSAAEESATLSFADKAQRTSFSTTQQVWEQNGITFTNDKASSTTNVADYADPVRLYAKSSITVAVAEGNIITKIVFTCNSSSYATALKNSVGDEATASDKKVTIVPTKSANNYTTSLTAQVRVDSLTVYYEAASSCAHTNTTTATVEATCTEAGSTTVTCDDCGETVSTTETLALGHNYENHVCTVCDIKEPKATFIVNGEVIGDAVYGETITLPVCDYDVSAFNKYDYVFKGWGTEVIEEGVTSVSVNDVGTEVKLTAEENTFYAVFGYSAAGVIAAYDKVTSAPSDWSGTYLIVYEAGNLAFNGGLKTLDASSNTISVDISNGKILSYAVVNAAAFVIDENGYIKSASGFYIGQSKNDNGLVANETTSYTNTLSINSDGTVNIVSGGAYLRYNASSNQNRFRYYKSSSYTNQKAICLYKLTEATGTSTFYTTVLEAKECNHSNTTETTVNSTCTETGSITVTCDDCGEIVSVTTTEALGHTETIVDGEAATCENTGLTEGKCCSECETILVEQEKTPISEHITNDDGICTTCGERVITFTFGDNGEAKHDDGNATSNISYVSNGYALSSSVTEFVYLSATDAKGNSCIKLGKKDEIGSFTFEVPCDVNYVVIYVAKYKANDTKVDINGTVYDLETNSNDGYYTAITVDTTTTKTVDVSTVNGTERAMINTIQYVLCDHSDVTHVEAKAATCYENGNIEYWYCEACGQAWLDADCTLNTNLKAVVLPMVAHTEETIPGVAPTWGTSGRTEGTKCSVCGEILVEQNVSIKILTNVIVGNNLDIMFGFNPKVVDSWEGYSVELVREFSDGTTEKTKLDYSNWSLTDEGDAYAITYNKLFAYEMCDKITVTLYDANGNVCGTATDSIQSYAMRMLEKYKGNEVACRVLVDMLNYGAVTQQHLDMNTDKLANALLTEEQKSYATETVEFANKESYPAEYYGSNLVVASHIKYMLGFNTNKEGMYAEISYTNYMGDEVVIERVDLVRSGNLNTVTIDGLTAADARQDITITVYNSDNTVYVKMVENMAAYCARKNNQSPVFEAFMKFADSAKAHLLELQSK